MKTIRIIPRLDIKGPNLVKGIHLEGLRVLGKPSDFAKFYYENGADELMYADVVASLYERNSLHDFISETAREIFIPLTVSGGIRTLEDIKSALRAGADKVSLNTAVVKNPEIIKEAALRYGSSTIVVTIEACKQSNGNYLAYTDNGREFTGLEVVSWAKKMEELGAGEIVITSIDKEGTGMGFDIELVRQISEAVDVPVVAHGGAASAEDVLKVIVEGKADAVMLSSILHYDFIQQYQFEKQGEEGNVEFLKSGRTFSKIKPTNLQHIKSFLAQNSIDCRN
jgi:imidazole glycerol-phosphate synthase subunit HisF